MKTMLKKNACVRGLAAAALTAISLSFAASPACAESVRPPLVITNQGIPENLRDKIYSKPVRTREVTASEVRGREYFEDSGQTVVGEKIRDIESQLSQLQSSLAGLMAKINTLQKQNEDKAAQYYADVATISTQLQTGTTKGNPRLVRRLRQAEVNLENLGSSAATLGSLATEAQTKASEASYLLEATRAAYALSGAVEEDHVHLAELEDAINNTSVIIERLLNNVSDDITRSSTYLSSERVNLRTLALAVDNGDLYGKSLSERPFSSAGAYQPQMAPSLHSARDSSSSGATASVTPAILEGPRPLVKIRFDRANVDYEQPVYMAVNEALNRYPNATFDLIAVTPTEGNAAEVAIESTRARRNAEKVLRTLTQMGLSLDRINLSYSQSAEAKSNEVHLFIR